MQQIQRCRVCRKKPMEFPRESSVNLREDAPNPHFPKRLVLGARCVRLQQDYAQPSSIPVLVCGTHEKSQSQIRSNLRRCLVNQEIDYWSDAVVMLDLVMWIIFREPPQQFESCRRSWLVYVLDGSRQVREQSC